MDTSLDFSFTFDNADDTPSETMSTTNSISDANSPRDLNLSSNDFDLKSLEPITSPLMGFNHHQNNYLLPPGLAPDRSGSNSSQSSSLGSHDWQHLSTSPAIENQWPDWLAHDINGQMHSESQWEWKGNGMGVDPAESIHLDHSVVNPNALHIHPLRTLSHQHPSGYAPTPQDILTMSSFADNSYQDLPSPNPPHVLTPPAEIKPPRRTKQVKMEPDSGAGATSDDISRRVREATGIRTAIPNDGSVPQIHFPSSNPTPKLPIPRLPRPPTPTYTSTPSPPLANAPPPRTKTSHTTIERRYRTNLNARITALRHAVPALRILDKVSFPDEKPDERGYVDGVKAARKASKASILGKAVEYIRVLKNRELRLRRESSGLKSLVCGLVGGDILLQEWEREWVQNFGGEELDEVGAADFGLGMGGSDDEDESDDEGDEKPKKKVKAAVPESKKKGATMAVTMAAPVTPPQTIAGEKRKRGRPRKNPSPLDPSPDFTVSGASPSEVGAGAGGGGGKYLLGLFLFFSFFKPSPQNTSSPVISHVGSVLGSTHRHLQNFSSSIPSPTTPPSNLEFQSQIEGGWNWTQTINDLHTLISFVLFLSLFLPYVRLPGRTKDGSVGVLSVFGAAWRRLIGRKGDKNGWVKVAEGDLANDSLPLLTRLHTILSFPTSPKDTTPAASELTSLALLTLPVSTHFASKYIKQASVSTLSQPTPLAEKRFLSWACMGVKSVENLWNQSSEWDLEEEEEDGERSKSPLRVLSEAYTATKARDVLREVFVRESEGVGADDNLEHDIRDVLRMGKSLNAQTSGSSLGEVIKRLDAFSKGNLDTSLFLSLSDLISEDASFEVEVRSQTPQQESLSLLRVLFLLRRLSLPSASAEERVSLLRALNGGLFEEAEEMEDARDRLVDRVREVGLKRRRIEA